MNAGIPLADARRLRRLARPARVLTMLLAAAAIGCAVAALLVARNPRTRTLVPLGRNADAVLVLDLSASISADTFSRIAGTLRTLSTSNGRFALVVFSDLAYEALPPGTPGADLAPLIRYFNVPSPQGGQPSPIFPPNPWANTFTAGTTISAGMQLALQIALAQRPRPTIVLVSDLDDNPTDLPALSGVLAEIRGDQVPVRVVGLNPASDDLAYFTAALGGNARIIFAPTFAQAAPRQTTPFPWALAALALGAAAALGLREGWAPKLDWRGS
ncbi:MAG: vWA domain-containing protein [Solirubrobacteraceae bacterium]